MVDWEVKGKMNWDEKCCGGNRKLVREIDR